MVNGLSFGSLTYDLSDASKKMAKKFVTDKNLRKDVVVSSIVDHSKAVEINSGHFGKIPLPGEELQIESKIKGDKDAKNAHEQKLMDLIKSEFGIKPFHTSKHW